jgi:hypothetical protein
MFVSKYNTLLTPTLITIFCVLTSTPARAVDPGTGTALSLGIKVADKVFRKSSPDPTVPLLQMNREL